MSIELKRLARLEALLSGMPGDRELRLLLEQLDPGPGGTVTWLDPRNAAITVLPGRPQLGNGVVSASRLPELSSGFPLLPALVLRRRLELGGGLSRQLGLASIP